jgi:Ran GTPase-activating protein (RanGAP) involved in mRNA processing and transport
MEALTDLNYQHLKIVRLWKVELQDEGLRSICNYIDKVGSIEYLDLMDNKITPLGCEFLGKTLLNERNNIRKLKIDNN